MSKRIIATKYKPTALIGWWFRYTHICKCHKPHVALHTCKNNDTKYNHWHAHTCHLRNSSEVNSAICCNGHYHYCHSSLPNMTCFLISLPLFLRITPPVLPPPISDLRVYLNYCERGSNDDTQVYMFIQLRDWLPTKHKLLMEGKSI